MDRSPDTPRNRQSRRGVMPIGNRLLGDWVPTCITPALLCRPSFSLLRTPGATWKSQTAPPDTAVVWQVCPAGRHKTAWRSVQTTAGRPRSSPPKTRKPHGSPVGSRPVSNLLTLFPAQARRSAWQSACRTPSSPRTAATPGLSNPCPFGAGEFSGISCSTTDNCITVGLGEILSTTNGGRPPS